MTQALPILLSVPHAGWRVPGEVARLCILEPEQVEADGDVGARGIFLPLRDHVRAFETSDVARAIVDLNRAPGDFSKDGVIKTHTCWNEPIFSEQLPQDVAHRLIENYYEPYHKELSAYQRRRDLIIAVDCHTMAEKGPPVGPDSGKARPRVCIGNGQGSCPEPWLDLMVEAFKEKYDPQVAVDEPFAGGYITQVHGQEMPWVQLELSREEFIPVAEKSVRVLAALRMWIEGVKKLRAEEFKKKRAK